MWTTTWNCHLSLASVAENRTVKNYDYEQNFAFNLLHKFELFALVLIMPTSGQKREYHPGIEATMTIVDQRLDIIDLSVS